MSEPLLEVHNLKKCFNPHKGLLGRLAHGHVSVPAVDGVSFQVGKHETVGLVGESGCGKTTTGKAILKLTGVDDGRIVYKGDDITTLDAKGFRPWRSQMQMIFQDLDAALNPKIRVRDILREAVKLHHPGMGRGEVDAKVGELMERVNLKASKLTSRPPELSGGEKRRVGIARVLAVDPEFIVADEPTSALDVSIQAQVINLLQDLQEQLGLSYLFISHDLQLVEMISHRVAVMYLGRIVETGPAAEVIKQPRHPYTKALWSSLVEKEAAEFIPANGIAADDPTVITDFQRPRTGCRFAPRCPRYQAMGRPSACTDPDNEPHLAQGEGPHPVACHFPL